MENYHGSWFLLGVLIALVTGLALSGCATTSYMETRATLSPTQLEVLAVVEVFQAAKTYEEFKATLANEVVLKSSYLSGKGLGEATFTDPRTYWDAFNTKRKLDTTFFISRQSTRRGLTVAVFGSNTEVSWTLEVQKKDFERGGWRGDVHYLFKLRRESGAWKIYYFQQ